MYVIFFKRTCAFYLPINQYTMKTYTKINFIKSIRYIYVRKIFVIIFKRILSSTKIHCFPITSNYTSQYTDKSRERTIRFVLDKQPVSPNTSYC